jgi:hypothetical protein
VTYREHLFRQARRYLVRSLRESRGNVTEAARAAGLNRTDFYKRLAAVGLEPNLYRPCVRRSRAQLREREALAKFVGARHWPLGPRSK